MNGLCLNSRTSRTSFFLGSDSNDNNNNSNTIAI